MMFVAVATRVKLRCPLCGDGRVIDARDQATANSITLYPPEESDRAQLFAKCGKCGKQIGIAFTSET